MPVDFGQLFQIAKLRRAFFDGAVGCEQVFKRLLAADTDRGSDFPDENGPGNLSVAN